MNGARDIQHTKRLTLSEADKLKTRITNKNEKTRTHTTRNSKTCGGKSINKYSVDR